MTPEEILTLTLARRATLGDGWLICLDGPAGSGKTTLAAAIAELAGAPVVHMDDLLPGWRGLPEVGPHVLGLLRPLAAGKMGHYRRYDWTAGEYRETHQLDPGPLLVLEGVGSGGTAWADLVTTLVWIETDPAEQLRRGLARDGEAERHHWLTWLEDEALVFRQERTRERADVLIRT